MRQGGSLTKKEVILDTNAVLRFITGDNMEKCKKVSDLIDTSDCIVPIEVIAEAIYNLEKFYKHSRQLIADEKKDFIAIKKNLVFEENIVRYGCNTFASTNLDFVDCLLVAYANVKGNPIFTFDEYLIKQLGQNAFNQRYVPSIKDAYGIFKDLKGMDTTIERDEEDRI
jgi:predicted nucleic-acid-binding protein